MDNKVIAAALAGLLHDVGKMEQRALVDPWKLPEGIDKEGQPAHAAWTQYFVQHYVPKQWQSSAFAGAYHHHPEKSPAEDKSLGELVALADKLSAGERADLIEKSKKQPRQMVSIFDRLSLKDPAVVKAENFIPLRALNLREDALFPDKQIGKEKEGNDYAELIEGLRKAAKEDTPNGEVYIENLLGALQRYAWCVPSAYYHSVPDVSLYDHLRMTAALAVCMAERSSEDIHVLLDLVSKKFHDEKFSDNRLEEPLAILVGGDMSGIQNFIYTLSSKKAAQTLRGRSFYLQLLTEAVLRFVLKKLGLPYTNVIYSGGGHFFLLAPVIAMDKLADIRREITEKILTHHGTSLYFAIGSAEVPASGFAAGEFPKHWNKMHTALGIAKQHRYTELGGEMHGKIFAVPENGGNPDNICSVCGGDTFEIKGEFTDDDESLARICSMCDSFSKDLGKELTETNFVALGWHKPQDEKPETFLNVLRSFGLQFELLKDEKQKVTLKNAEWITLWALNDPTQGYPKVAGNIPTTHLLRYTVNDIPIHQEGIKKGEIITFDELQEMVGDGKGGFQRLGVLRMDVDNLGDVFKTGLGKYATLARISTLSFQMSLFFEGWVKRICNMQDFKNKIYAVYAGGDDVFLLGPWDVMPKLALKIHDDFERYTANHPDLHISAGLAFIGGKYPIYQAAKDAEKELNKAKKNKKEGKEKDSFAFIGNVWMWAEFKEVHNKFGRIVKVVEELNGPQAIIQTLRELAEMKVKRADNTKHKKDIWGPWQWRGAYSLKRMEERAKNNPELADEISAISKDLEPDYANINQWGAAARWAQLKTRTKSNNPKESE